MGFWLSFCGGFALVISVLLGTLTVPRYTDNRSENIEILKESEIIESQLSNYKQLLGDDYLGYRNHLYRVLTYANWFLGGRPSKLNNNKYWELLQIALVYHDIGLWTHKQLNYLQPSVDLAIRSLAASEKIYDTSDVRIVKDMITYHHKITYFNGFDSNHPNTPYPGGKEALDIIDAFRKADWIDATHTIITKDMPINNINKVVSELPDLGFYNTLLGFGQRIHGNDFWPIFNEFSKIYYF